VRRVLGHYDRGGQDRPRNRTERSGDDQYPEYSRSPDVSVVHVQLTWDGISPCQYFDDQVSPKVCVVVVYACLPAAAAQKNHSWRWDERPLTTIPRREKLSCEGVGSDDQGHFASEAQDRQNNDRSAKKQSTLTGRDFRGAPWIYSLLFCFSEPLS